MGHTDVVPVNPDGWSRDPFGGELVDGEVWGRGAIDMLNLTASMAVAFRHLAARRVPAEGHLSTSPSPTRRPAATGAPSGSPTTSPTPSRADYVLTETGGLVIGRPRPAPKVTITVGEKGVAVAPAARPRHARPRLDAVRRRQRARQGGRGRAPPRRRTARQPQINDLWRELRRRARPRPTTQRRRCSTPTRVLEACRTLRRPGHRASSLHACTHTTFSPNVAHGGVKTNVIPDVVDLDVDIRTMPGETDEDVRAHTRRGARRSQPSEVELSIIQAGESHEVTHRHAAVDSALEQGRTARVPRRELMPALTVGGTDAALLSATPDRWPTASG